MMPLAMPLRRLLAGLVVLSSLLGLIAFAVLTFTAREVDNLAEQQRRSRLVTREVSALLALTHEYVLHREERAEQQWRKRYSTLMKSLDLGASATLAWHGVRPELHDELQALPELFEGLVGVSSSTVPDTLTTKRRELLVDRLLTETQAISEEAFQWESRTTSERNSIERRLVVLAISLPGMLAVLFAVAAWFLARRVLRPVVALQRAMAAAASGDLAVRCGSVAQDEIGDLARRFDHMANELQARTKSIQDAEAFLRNITDNLLVRIAYVDRHMRYRFVNQRCCERLERSRYDIIGHTQEELLGRPNDPQTQEQIDAALRGEACVFEFTEEVGGEEVCIESSLIPDFAADGSVKGFFSTGVDITERERQRAQIERALSEKEVLLSEIHHRVKNNMQVISSLLQLQSRNIESAEVRELFAESQSRIASMALIHEMLYQSHDFARVDFADYVKNLISMLRSSHGEGSSSVSIDVQSTSMVIDIDCAIPAGLILNELVSNCFKHAFPEGVSGRIEVAVAAYGGDQVRLTVRDNGKGVGKGFDPMATRSLGLKLVHILADQLSASLAFGGERGLECELVFSRHSSRRPRP
jgi:PAS domain S-box-containing protein